MIGTALRATATPRDYDGGPLRIDSAALRALRAGVPLDEIAAAGHHPGEWPVIGPLVEREGVRLREVTFVADDTGIPTLVHLNGITDAHRRDVRPALLHPVPGRDLRALAYLLPEGLTASYRIAAVPELPVDAGSTREGWMRVHRAGQPDPRNPHGIRTPLGGASSLLRMPGWEPHPARASAPLRDLATRELRIPGPSGERSVWVITPRAEPVPDTLLVLFDGDTWMDAGIERLLAARTGPAVAVAVVSSISLAVRSAELPHLAVIARVLADEVLPAVAFSLGRRHGSEQVIVAGQSYGGLAAAALVARHPEITRTGIVQSGSFHFRAAAADHPPAERPGDLVEWMRDRALSGRLVVQVGTEEPDLHRLAREFVAVAESAGMDLSSRLVAGGHDYAWWVDGVLHALDELLIRNVVGAQPRDLSE
ncbi:enterochelin esterase domain-containing protein [Schumannella sp. 10F1B-5-1]|uniref:enterochelin esterase domain-containing protein n=1 Tax=Schumannella sp. 10F1B-5-1 TaxID=2590780 RepID=UPI0015E83CCE|nr:enterochelin esterase domain-containing protein [Schumannella sp. 10F1B-5-1]